MSDAGRADRPGPALLGNPSLAVLRQRTSEKWRTYPDDVLPSFVAEMDFDLARPIIDAVTESMAASDAGYGHIGRLAEAFAGFAAKTRRFGFGTQVRSAKSRVGRPTRTQSTA